MKRRWTPLHLKLFLWFAVSTDPYWLPSSAATEYTAELVTVGLLEWMYPTDDPVLRTTEMGKVFLDALVSTPLPVQTWHIPEVDHG